MAISVFLHVAELTWPLVLFAHFFNGRVRQRANESQPLVGGLSPRTALMGEG